MNYNWKLKNTKFTKNQGTVFSCFGGGGGSTMGYKLAGFDVIGFNEIDPKMAGCYFINHHPKYSYVEPIQEFKLRKDLPKDLYELDILDFSFPCTSFSMAGNREKNWGKEKKFREGTKKQILDTLAFDALDLAKELQPKVIIAENVKGLLMGEAKKYLTKILETFNKIGYKVIYKVLNASKMGVPQKRERVFILGLRNELCDKIGYSDLFNNEPLLHLNFNETPIPFKEIESFNEAPCFANPSPSCLKGWNKAKYGQKLYENQKFDTYKIHPEKTLNTITASPSKGRSGPLHYKEFRMLTPSEVFKASSFPLDYKCNDPFYVCGMSVPPLMIAKVVEQINKQWLTKFKK